MIQGFSLDYPAYSGLVANLSVMFKTLNLGNQTSEMQIYKQQTKIALIGTVD
jgi:hypothetical protein